MFTSYIYKYLFVIGIMDCTVKNLEKTFDIKQKAMVNKLHNMQWLKNMSHSSNPYV